MKKLLRQQIQQVLEFYLQQKMKNIHILVAHHDCKPRSLSEYSRIIIDSEYNGRNK